MNEWIDINEELPMDNETVLVNLKGRTVGYMTMCFVVYEVPEGAEEELDEEEYRNIRYGFYQTYSPWHRYSLNDVDYWMPIPDMPTGK